MDIKAIYQMILAFAEPRYDAPWWPKTPDTTDAEEEVMDYDVSIDNYISAKMAEFLEEINSLI